MASQSISTGITNKPTAHPPSVNPMFAKVQEEFNNHQDEFKKQNLINSRFDLLIRHLEDTTNRIDTNVDKILDIMESQAKSKAPRVTENMDTETSSILVMLSNEGDDDL